MFAVGTGSVVFEPVEDGKQMQQVVFSRVLHVPSLSSNLLSILSLTTNFGWNVNI